MRHGREWQLNQSQVPFFRDSANPLPHSARHLVAHHRAHPAGAVLPEHRHAQGQLGIPLTGTMTIVTPTARWLAPPGRGIWTPPEEPHAGHYGEASAIVQVLVPPPACAGFPAIGGIIEVSPLLRELALEATRLAPGDPAESPLIALMQREVARPMAGPALHVPLGRDPRLAAVMRRLIDEPDCPLGVEALATTCGASPRTLARLFRTETGMSFSRWRDHLRINLAVERLARGEPVTRIAFDLGYQSAAAFTTMFGRLTGTPPARMQRALRSAQTP